MIRKSLHINYEVRKRNDADLRDGFTEREAHMEAAAARAGHVAALFSLLQLVDVQSRWEDEGVISNRLESLSDALSGVGELGAAIADGLYCDICELREGGGR